MSLRLGEEERGGENRISEYIYIQNRHTFCLALSIVDFSGHKVIFFIWFSVSFFAKGFFKRHIILGLFARVSKFLTQIFDYIIYVYKRLMCFFFSHGRNLMFIYIHCGFSAVFAQTKLH